MENRLSIRNLLPIGENLIATRQDVHLKTASGKVPARAGRIKNNELARGDHDFKFLLKGFWILLDDLNVILKIINIHKWTNGEEYCVALSHKTKAQIVAPKYDSRSITNLQRTYPPSYLACPIIVTRRIVERNYVSMRIRNASYVAYPAPIEQQIPFQHQQRAAIRIDKL